MRSCKRMDHDGLGRAAAALLCALGLAGSRQAQALPPGAPLRDLAEAKGRYFGFALAPNLIDSGSYGTLGSAEFNGVTPENAMKWDATEPSQNAFNWSGADQVVAFAQQHSQRVRGHTLVWHSQLPGWVSNLPSSSVKDAMLNHVKTVAKHYAGKLYAWDVVNEIFNEDGSFRRSPFFDAMGKGFVAEAFKAAREADPTAKLYINDYNIEGRNAKSDGLYDLVKSLVSEGVPIDGVGFQAHFIVGGLPSDLKANLQRFADLGLDVAITELDVRASTPISSSDLSAQAADYAAVVETCLSIARCAGITVWGIDDGHSWVPSTFAGQGDALLFDASYGPKPAYAAVQNALGGSGADGGNTSGDADATEPSAPGTPVGSDITPTSLTLTWDASTDNVGVEKYHVFRQAYSRDVELATTSDTSVKLTGLVSATTYSFYVTAEDAAGNVSVASAIGKATTAKAADAGTGPDAGTDAGDRADAKSVGGEDAGGEDAGAASPVESKGGSAGLGCSLGGSSRSAGHSLPAFAALAIGILRRGARERAGSAPSVVAPK